MYITALTVLNHSESVQFDIYLRFVLTGRLVLRMKMQTDTKVE